jgi:hypothetical protein
VNSEILISIRTNAQAGSKLVATRRQIRAVVLICKKVTAARGLDVSDENRLKTLGDLLGRPFISTNYIRSGEASAVIESAQRYSINTLAAALSGEEK